MPVTNQPYLSCLDCNQRLPWDVVNTPDLSACPTCGVGLQAVVFPSFLKPPETGKPAETILVDGEASCFYHPQKKAVIPCNHCGRFLCSLCDIEFESQHLCPRCIDDSRRQGKMDSLQNKRTLYDDIAISLSLLPIALPLFFFFSVFTAPAAIYVCFRYWKTPTSVLPRSRARYVIALIFAFLQVSGWIAGLVYLLIQMQKG